MDHDYAILQIKGFGPDEFNFRSILDKARTRDSDSKYSGFNSSENNNQKRQTIRIRQGRDSLVYGHVYGIWYIPHSMLSCALIIWAFLDMSSVILFLVPRIQFKARTARYRNAKYDKNGTSKFCTIKWAKETDINFEHQKKLKIYEERSGVKNSFEICRTLWLRY